jgi:protein-S-isoprenylcysteine O-methyltransferase Ste14
MSTILELILYMAAVGLFFQNYLSGSFDPLKYLCFTLGIFFYLLWIVARIELRKYFAVLPKAQGLVTKGLYSKFRNPIYLFSSLALFFAILPSNNLGLYVMLAIIVYIQTVRARKEAVVLEKKFGKKYLNYKSKTWF